MDASRTPSIHQLAPEDRLAVVAVAERLASRGHGTWVVGGAVRDLALGRRPKDVDLATDALPEQVEAAFARTVAVGKAFGTVVVLWPEAGGEAGVRPREFQVTTLRRDGAYSDGRHPDAVVYGTSLEEDAARRDFTCNALYLEPATDRVYDPFCGLGDLMAGRLRAVGDPARRFREDGLRLLRMARFAAAYGLAVEASTWQAACENLDALAGLSPERVLAELEALGRRAAPGRAVALLVRSGVLTRLLPGLVRDPVPAAQHVPQHAPPSPADAEPRPAEERSAGAPREDRRRTAIGAAEGPDAGRSTQPEQALAPVGDPPGDAPRSPGRTASRGASEGPRPSVVHGAFLDRMAALGDAPGEDLFLAALLAPSRAGSIGWDEAERRLLALRPSRARVEAVRGIWEGVLDLRALTGVAFAEDGGPVAWRERARLVRLGRTAAFLPAAALLAADGLGREAAAALHGMERWVAERGPDGLRPAPLLTSRDLAATTIPRGRAWGAILWEAEDRQLGGLDRNRDDALAWLRDRAARSG